MIYPEISVVSPVYNGASTIDELTSQLINELTSLSITYEIIYVDDGSTDHSWSRISSLARMHPAIKALKLSRNFGQHNCIYAGLVASSGNWVVVMDCDLQDRPDQIVNLYRYTQACDCHIVQGQRIDRSDTLFRRTMSYLFYSLLGYLTNTQQDCSIASFGIYSRKAIDSLLSMHDYHKSFLPMLQWTGFDIHKIPLKHAARTKGKSNYNLYKLFSLAINTSIAFSDKPLKLVASSGFLISVASFLIGLFYVVAYLFGVSKVPGYTSLIISIWLSTGLIIFVLGIMGIYVGKVFETTKNRPNYIIEHSINVAPDN